LISQNQEAFVNLLREGDETGESQAEPAEGVQYLQISEEEKAAIDRVNDLHLVYGL
jgi:hypothetical protein